MGTRRDTSSPLCCGLRPTVLLCVLCASSFSFLLGYDIGIMSSAKRLIVREMALSTGEVEVLVGILNLVSGPGGLISGRIADVFGRRPTAAVACSLTIAGSLLMAASQSYSALLTGRVITGLGVGSCFHVAPLYIAEVAPKQVRGRLVSFFDLFINVGITVGFVVGYALTPPAAASRCADGCAAWRWMLGLGAVPPALILLGLMRLPETPRFLVAAGRGREALGVLRRIYTDEEASATYAMLREDGEHAKPLPLFAGLRRVCLPARGAPRALIVAGIGVAFWQQASGVEAAVYYTPETLEAAGISDEQTLMLANVGVGLIKVGFIVLAAALVERHGRRKLLLISSAWICASHIGLGLSFASSRNVALALFSQCSFMAAFSIGAGPCSMMVAAELFPLGIRGFALGVATLVNRTTSGCVALTFLSLTHALTPQLTYYGFAAIAALSFAFIHRLVPETKGRALEEIERELTERFSPVLPINRDARGRREPGSDAPVHAAPRAAEPAV